MRPGAIAIEKTILLSFAIAARSSAVADHYATKYLAKPQQWLASALGALIAGFRKKEEEQKEAGEEMSVQKLAQRKLRTAIFAANRSVWISSCEACLFLETGGAAVLSHPDVSVHGRKGLFMMSECKRILNKEVAGGSPSPSQFLDFRKVLSDLPAKSETEMNPSSLFRILCKPRNGLGLGLPGGGRRFVADRPSKVPRTTGR